MKRRRCGFTLIELLVVLALLAVILPMAGRMIVLLFRMQSQTADSLTESIALSRFSRAFRQDAHAARRVADFDVARLQSQLVLQFAPSRVVRYTVEPSGAIVRAALNGSNVENRETYRLPRVRSRFEASEATGMVAVIHEMRFRAEQASGVASPPSAALRVEASVGRDNRFNASTNDAAAKRSRSPIMAHQPPVKGRPIP